jgi:hypothetical protein
MEDDEFCTSPQDVEQNLVLVLVEQGTLQAIEPHLFMNLIWDNVRIV